MPRKRKPTNFCRGRRATNGRERPFWLLKRSVTSAVEVAPQRLKPTRKTNAVIVALALRHPKSYGTKKRNRAVGPGFRSVGWDAVTSQPGAADSENCAGAFHVRGCISRQPGFRGARQRDVSSNCGTSLRFRPTVSIIFVTERKYIYLTDCVYSVGETVPGWLTPECFKVLHSSGWQSTFRAVSRRLPNNPFRFIRPIC